MEDVAGIRQTATQTHTHTGECPGMIILKKAPTFKKDTLVISLLFHDSVYTLDANKPMYQASLYLAVISLKL